MLNYGFKRDLNQPHSRSRAAQLPDSVARRTSSTSNTAHAPATTKCTTRIWRSSRRCSTSRRRAPIPSATTAIEAEDIVRSRGAIAELLNGADGIAGTADDFDAFLASGNNLAATPAKAGYPSIVVPGGFFQNVVTPPFPDGFNAKRRSRGRDVLRPRVQRTDADRPRVRVRSRRRTSASRRPAHRRSGAILVIKR